MSKLLKFFKNPGEFWRDYFLKKYPLSFSDSGIELRSEQAVLLYEKLLSSQYVCSDPIDIVYTWVDSSEKKWIVSYEAEKNKVRHADYGLNAFSQARFSNHGELEFSLRSVMENIPWVNNIFIITAGQRPKQHILNCKCHIIDHHDIIESKYLPTFNSHVIEAHLHKIEGLSEKFIYFNDDVFVMTPVPPGHFYRNTSVASLFVTWKTLSAGRKRGLNTPTYHACLNGNSLLQKKYNACTDTILSHTYYPLFKSEFARVYSEYYSSIEPFFINKFRSNNDFNLASFLVPMSMFYEGKAVPAVDLCYYFNIASLRANTLYSLLLKRKKVGFLPHSCCINSSSDEVSSVQAALFIEFCNSMWK